MEEHRHIVPSNFSSQQRLPLIDSNANAQYHKIDSIDIYGDQKGETGHQSRLEYLAPPFKIPTLHSQPASRHQLSALELRKHQYRTPQRLNRSRNPIIDSPQYQAYRSRQSSKDGPDEQKWPDDLEDLFLEGTCSEK